MIQNSSLKDMIGLETQVKKDVRNLDSEMKKLVEQNYHKFISATVTIREIQEQVGDVEAQMQRLMQQLSPGARVVTLESDHSPYLCAPQALADALIAAIPV